MRHLTRVGGLLVVLGLARLLPGMPIYAQGAAGPGVNARMDGYLNASDAGVVCDGKTDDTAALQRVITAAVAAGGRTVLLPAGTCRLTSTLIVGGSTNPRYDHVNIQGTGPDSTVLGFAIDDKGEAVALDVSHLAYFRISGLRVSGPVETKSHAGKTIGIRLTSAFNTGGTYTTSGSFEQVTVSGFHIGMLAGDGRHDAASEITCVHCVFNGNDIGWQSWGQNSLDFWFYDVALGNNHYGMQPIADAPRVMGGTMYGNDADFFDSGFGILSIQDVRSETPGSGGLFLAGSIGLATIQRAIVTNPVKDGDAAINVDLQQTLRIVDSDFSKGSISLAKSNGNSFSSIYITNTRAWPAATGWPVELPPYGAGMWVELQNNRHYRDGTVDYLYDDRVGSFAGNGNSTSERRWLPYVTTLRDIGDSTPNGGEILHRVRGLAYGSEAFGRNLRDQVTFGTSGTAAFTFVRTAPVITTNQSLSVAFAAGALNAIDVGKKIVIPGATTACGPSASSKSDAVDATVAALSDATHAVVVPRKWQYQLARCSPVITESGSRVAMIGENEPDAAWFPVGLVCDADARYWVTDITAGGAMFHSSDPRSTATCRFAVMR